MKLSDAKACVLVATYNNCKTLARVLEGALEFSNGNDIIVINDGSTDDTRKILDGFGPRIICLGHTVNKGKGYSLRKGFAEAIRRGFEHAIPSIPTGSISPGTFRNF